MLSKLEAWFRSASVLAILLHVPSISAAPRHMDPVDTLKLRQYGELKRLEQRATALPAGWTCVAFSNAQLCCESQTPLKQFSDSSDVTLVLEPSSQAGCYSDGTNARTLSAYSVSSSSNTPQTCLAACQSRGYYLAGVEYGMFPLGNRVTISVHSSMFANLHRIMTFVLSTFREGMLLWIKHDCVIKYGTTCGILRL